MAIKFFRRREDRFDYGLSRTCQNCHTQFKGKYCPRCSEKVIEPVDRTIQGFASNVFNAFTFIDGKFARSFKYLLLKPGQMSADIAKGIQQPYMKPVAFFFVGNFIYFLFPYFQTFNTSLYNQLHSMPYSTFANQLVSGYVQAHHTTLDSLTPLYNTSSTNWSKLILIVLSLLLLPFMMLLNYNKRSNTADHLLFSIEYASYIIFVPTILLGSISYALILIGNLFSLDWSVIGSDQYSIYSVGILLGYFQIMGTHHFYRLPIWRNLLNVIPMVFVFYIVIHIYRFILFIITMWTLN
jgi:hypothetical protein